MSFEYLLLPVLLCPSHHHHHHHYYSDHYCYNYQSSYCADHKKRKKGDPASPTTKHHRKTKKTTERSTRNAHKPRTTGANTTSSRRHDDGLTPETPGSDPSPMKRPPNAFLLFTRACRWELRDVLVPSMDSQAVSMVLGHVWRFLSKAERTNFYEEAERMRQVYLGGWLA